MTSCRGSRSQQRPRAPRACLRRQVVSQQDRRVGSLAQSSVPGRAEAAVEHGATAFVLPAVLLRSPPLSAWPPEPHPSSVCGVPALWTAVGTAAFSPHVGLQN